MSNEKQKAEDYLREYAKVHCAGNEEEARKHEVVRDVLEMYEKEKK